MLGLAGPDSMGIPDAAAGGPPEAPRVPSRGLLAGQPPARSNPTETSVTVSSTVISSLP